MKLFQSLLIVVIALHLASCATTPKDHLDPTVELVGIKQSANTESALEFDIKLRITNPNNTPLELSGLYYELSLDGIDVVNGTAKDVPVIEGFDSQTIRVNSAANIINGARFLARFVNNSTDLIDYKLRIKLGSKSAWSSARIIETEGEIPLR